MEIATQNNNSDVFSLHAAWDGQKLRQSLKRRAPFTVDFPETLQDIVDVIVIGKNGAMYSIKGISSEFSTPKGMQNVSGGETEMLSEGLMQFFRHFSLGGLLSEKMGLKQLSHMADSLKPLRKMASKNKKTAYIFTPREWTIVESMKKGLSNQEIATALEISLHTVKDHIKHIMKKMDIHTRSGVVGKLAIT